MKKQPKVIREKKWPSKESLKAAIRKLLDEKPADPLDIANAMRIRLKLACDMVDELVADGKIEPVMKDEKKAVRARTVRHEGSKKTL